LNRLLPGNPFVARISTKNQDLFGFILVFFCVLSIALQKRDSDSLTMSGSPKWGQSAVWICELELIWIQMLMKQYIIRNWHQIKVIWNLI
jgi:hypothetical protein